MCMGEVRWIRFTRSQALLITLPNNLLNPIIIYYAYANSSTTMPNHFCINCILLRFCCCCYCGFFLSPLSSSFLCFDFFSAVYLFSLVDWLCINVITVHIGIKQRPNERNRNERPKIYIFFFQHVIKKNVCIWCFRLDEYFARCSMRESARVLCQFQKRFNVCTIVHTSTSRCRCTSFFFSTGFVFT